MWIKQENLVIVVDSSYKYKNVSEFEWKNEFIHLVFINNKNISQINNIIQNSPL